MTEQLLWTETSSVGVESIDEQHKQIVEIANRLFREIVRDTGVESIFEILDEMARYAEQHFAYEENLLKEHGFPSDKLEQHLAEHQALTAQVHDFIQKARLDNDLIDLEVYDFLRDWMNDHLSRTDKEYALFLSSRGVR